MRETQIQIQKTETPSGGCYPLFFVILGIWLIVNDHPYFGFAVVILGIGLK